MMSCNQIKQIKDFPDIPDKAGRKTRKRGRRRTQAIAKGYVFHANVKNCFYMEHWPQMGYDPVLLSKNV